MRGDHRLEDGALDAARGPPPHARGSPALHPRRARSCGPTPACAGITRTWTSPAPATRAHPRMRGDHGVEVGELALQVGPPPHARGSRDLGDRVVVGARPTPACAGITAGVRSAWDAPGAHPRMRGDHRDAVAHEVERRGPPPHARGSPGTTSVRWCSRRPTPACAGITRAGSARSATATAHPRMRGDHAGAGIVKVAADGPPPHARGSPPLPLPPPPPPRPTPACAGITPRDPRVQQQTWAHPRMRGDHSVISASVLMWAGPPPHARGSPPLALVVPDRHRPTPACAGITRSRGSHG